MCFRTHQVPTWQADALPDAAVAPLQHLGHEAVEVVEAEDQGELNQQEKLLLTLEAGQNRDGVRWQIGADEENNGAELKALAEYGVGLKWKYLISVQVP